MAKNEETTEATTDRVLLDQAAVAVAAPGAERSRRRCWPSQGGRCTRSHCPRLRVVNVNGRSLEDYFPNKLPPHFVKDPFKVLDLEGAYDVIARIPGGGPRVRPAHCASASPVR